MHFPHLSHWKTPTIGSKCITTASHPCGIALSIICTPLFRGKMHCDWFHELEIFQDRWRHGEKVGYW